MRIQKRIEVKVISSKVLPQKFRSKLKDRQRILQTRHAIIGRLAYARVLRVRERSQSCP
jgi:hypothetical protein